MKKFLSLVLALVMTMSLVTISAGAKDFTDADKVNYDEAIAVLSAVKVIDGYTDGSFKPQTPLNRGQAAKIICNLVLGPTTAAELSATVAPFSDVPANNIFAGYITYCANEGIICGYGDGTFRPTASLTGYAFLKMLLGALGYDAEIEGYNNPGSFGIQVAKQAIGIGLNKGLKDTFNGNKTVTREEACLYALNTLKATMVEYDQKIVANVNGAQVTVGTSVAQDVKWGVATLNDGHIKNDGFVQFAEKYFPKLELEIGNGIYGRPANTWKLKKAEIGTFTSIEPTKVYTEGTDGDDIYKDLGKVVCDEKEYDWTAFVNGEEVAAKDMKVPAKGDKEYAYTGEGTVTEIYVDDDAETVTVCEINYYLGQVSKVKSDDDGEYITVKALSKGATLDDKTFYVDGYSEDDYVVFTVDYNDDKDFVIGEVCEPETVTAEVTRVENDKEEVVKAVYGNTYLKTSDGDKYTYTDGDDSAKFDQQWHMVYDLDAVNTKAHPELDKEYVLYLDPNGFVLAFKLAEKDTSKYLWVKDSDEELKDWVAKVILDDATVAKVDLKDKYTDGKNDVAIAWTVNKDTNGKNMTNIDELIWKYTVSDKGVYTLKKVNTQFLPEKLEGQDGVEQFVEKPDAKINNGRAYVTANGTTFIVDNETLFVDVENEKAYVGYKEVPNVDNAQLAYVLDGKGKIAEVVFILDGDIYDKDSTYFVLSGTDRESLKYDGDYYWEYSKAYVNGEKTKVYVSYDAAANTVLSKGVLYKATKTVDEQYITAFETVDKPVYTPTAVGVDAFWTKSDANKTYQFDCNEETIFVVVEYTKDGKWKIYDGDINDMKADDDYESIKVQVVENDDETAELVYIYKTEKAAPVKPNTGDVTLTLTGKLADATVWSKDGKNEYTGTEETKEFGVVVSKSFQIPENTTVTIVDKEHITGGKMDVALTTEDVTLGDNDVDIKNGTKVAITVDGKINYIDKGAVAPKNTVPAANGNYLKDVKNGYFSTDIVTATDGKLTVSDTSKGHEYFVACPVKGLSSDVKGYYGDEAVKSFIAKGETIELTFVTADESYAVKIDGEVVAKYEDVKAGDKATVKVTGAVEIVEIQSEKQFKADVASKTAGVISKTKEGVFDLKVDKTKNTATLVIAKGKTIANCMDDGHGNGTGIGKATKDLLNAGYTIKAGKYTFTKANSIDKSTGNLTVPALEAMQSLIPTVDSLVDTEDKTETLTITVSNATGASEVFTVTVTQKA